MRFGFRPGWFSEASARARRLPKPRVPANLGRWGMELFIEPSVRRLVGERLGVAETELLCGVSLRDDLAADSLDLVELTQALEAEFAIVVPQAVVDQVRTYDDLVAATGTLIRARCKAETRGAEPPARIWVRLVPPGAESRGTLERADWLTPYTAETIAGDALRAGRGARLEVTVAACTAAGLARVRDRFAGLARLGVEVAVQHGESPVGPPAVAPLALTDLLLDQLVGAHATVTITGYVGDDPWQADDLVTRHGRHVERFGDADPAEQAQALSGSGPCQFMDGPTPADRYRVTTEGHHIHAHIDRAQGEVPRATDVVTKGPTQLDGGPGRVGNARYFRTGLVTGVGAKGQPRTWREATYYSQDRAAPAFAIASSVTELTPPGHPAGRQEGLRAQFDLSSPSTNDFRARTATLECAADDGDCTLRIVVSAQLAGMERLAEVSLHGGLESTMGVRLLPEIPVAEIGTAASA